MLSVSRWTIHRRVREGEFPQPIESDRGGSRRLRWPTAQIVEWAADPAGYMSRIRRRRPYTPRKTSSK